MPSSSCARKSLVGHVLQHNSQYGVFDNTGRRVDQGETPLQSLVGSERRPNLAPAQRAQYSSSGAACYSRRRVHFAQSVLDADSECLSNVAGTGYQSSTPLT